MEELNKKEFPTDGWIIGMAYKKGDVKGELSFFTKGEINKEQIDELSSRLFRLLKEKREFQWKMK